MEERPGQSRPETLIGKTQGKRLKVAWRREGTSSRDREPKANWGFQRCESSHPLLGYLEGLSWASGSRCTSFSL